MAESMLVRRRIVGEALRRYREAADRRADEAASILGGDVKKITRIESGRSGIRQDDLRALLAGYGVSDREQQALVTIASPVRSGPGGCTDGVPGEVLDDVLIEFAASELVICETLQIPALLQTESYARNEATRTAARCSAASPDAMTCLTLGRQQIVRAKGHPTVRAFLSEGALQQPDSEDDAARGQLLHLSHLADHCSGVSIRILPHANLALLISDSFIIARLCDTVQLDVVRVATAQGPQYLLDRAAVACYRRLTSRLEQYCLSEPESVRFLARAAACPGRGGYPPHAVLSSV